MLHEPLGRLWNAVGSSIARGFAGFATATAAANALLALQHLSLSRPKDEEGKWDGGTNVRVFLRKFESAVERVVGVSDWQKYEELSNWTKGKAHKYVRSVSTRPPAEALAMAKQKLLVNKNLLA